MNDTQRKQLEDIAARLGEHFNRYLVIVEGTAGFFLSNDAEWGLEACDMAKDGINEILRGTHVPEA